LWVIKTHKSSLDDPGRLMPNYWARSDPDLRRPTLRPRIARPSDGAEEAHPRRPHHPDDFTPSSPTNHAPHPDERNALSATDARAA
jgi:hypothetical protein